MPLSWTAEKAAEAQPAVLAPLNGRQLRGRRSDVAEGASLASGCWKVVPADPTLAGAPIAWEVQVAAQDIAGTGADTEVAASAVEALPMPKLVAVAFHRASHVRTRAEAASSVGAHERIHSPAMIASFPNASPEFQRQSWHAVHAARQCQ